VREILESIEREYRRYKVLGEATFEQLTAGQLAHVAGPEGNSVVTLVWHISGNLRSRFTDFLTTDGEKPWRQRETEFDARAVTPAELREKWEEGWGVLFEALQELSDADLGAKVTIRGEALAVRDALHRSLAHTSYHVGQIVFLGKTLRGEEWRSLTIPRPRS
jgi:uncharacterized protein DUF1572